MEKAGLIVIAQQLVLMDQPVTLVILNTKILMTIIVIRLIYLFHKLFL